MSAPVVCDAPLVILPGLMCDSGMFGHQIRAFEGQCINGFYSRADNIEAMVDYVLARMPARCALLGHSMGARVALELYRRAPERVARLALADDLELYASLRAMCIDAGVAIYEAQINALLNRPDAAPVLASITCPTAVIVGRDDRWSPVDQHQDIAAAIAGSRLSIIEQAGHMAPAEEPVDFNEALRKWLS